MIKSKEELYIEPKESVQKYNSGSKSSKTDIYLGKSAIAAKRITEEKLLAVAYYKESFYG